MKKLKIYLDTSVINYLFANDTPEKKKITEDLFSNYIIIESYHVFVSDVVLEELRRTPDDLKRG